MRVPFVSGLGLDYIVIGLIQADPRSLLKSERERKDTWRTFVTRCSSKPSVNFRIWKRMNVAQNFCFVADFFVLEGEVEQAHTQAQNPPEPPSKDDGEREEERKCKLIRTP